MELIVKLVLTTREKKLLATLAAHMMGEVEALLTDGDIYQRKRGDELKDATDVLDRIRRLCA